MTLKKLASREDMDKEELLDKVKELQNMFRQTESDEEDDLMNEFDQEFPNWMWKLEKISIFRKYKLLWWLNIVYVCKHSSYLQLEYKILCEYKTNLFWPLTRSTCAIFRETTVLLNTWIFSWESTFKFYWRIGGKAENSHLVAVWPEST